MYKKKVGENTNKGEDKKKVKKNVSKLTVAPPSPLLVLSPTGSKCRNLKNKTPFLAVFFEKGRLWEGIGSLVGENTNKGEMVGHYRRSQPEA